MSANRRRAAAWCVALLGAGTLSACSPSTHLVAATPPSLAVLGTRYSALDASLLANLTMFEGPSTPDSSVTVRRMSIKQAADALAIIDRQLAQMAFPAFMHRHVGDLIRADTQIEVIAIRASKATSAANLVETLGGLRPYLAAEKKARQLVRFDLGLPAGP